jgi:hypothetical protein
MSESAGGSGRGKQRRKRHHYLPESYLKVWADGAGQVAVRRRDRTATFCTTTRNVAVEADLYALPTPEGPDDALEVALSEIEGHLPGYLAALRDRPTPRKGTTARDEISDLLALQIVRTREHVGQWMFRAFAAEYTGECPISREGMRRFLTEEYLGEAPREQEIQGARLTSRTTCCPGAATVPRVRAAGHRGGRSSPGRSCVRVGEGVQVRAAHKDHSRGGKVSDADASVRGRKRYVAVLPAAADSKGDSNSSDPRQAAATGDSAALSHDPRQRGMVKSCGRRVLIDHAATLVSASSDRSMSTPFSNLAPARTRATRCGPLTWRQRSLAASMSLNTMASPAARLPGPLVTLVLSRTVEKVDSIGLDVLRCTQCPAGKPRTRAAAPDLW